MKGVSRIIFGHTKEAAAMARWATKDNSGLSFWYELKRAKNEINEANMTTWDGCNLCRHNDRDMMMIRVQLSIREFVLSNTIALQNSTIRYITSEVKKIPDRRPR